MAETYKRIAALRPANTNEQQLYAVPADTQIITSLAICNQTAVKRTVRVALTDTVGAAAVEDWIIYDTILDKNETINLSGIAAETNNTIRVRVDLADSVSFVLHGLVID